VTRGQQVWRESVAEMLSPIGVDTL